MAVFNCNSPNYKSVVQVNNSALCSLLVDVWFNQIFSEFTKFKVNKCLGRLFKCHKSKW